MFAQDGSGSEQQAFMIENYTTEVNNTGEGLEFDSSIADARASLGDPATFEFSVTNTANETLFIRAAFAPPFGVLVAIPAGQTSQGGDITVLLGRNLYNLSYQNGDFSAPDPGSITPIEPGETLTKQYDLRADEPNLTTGLYTLGQNTFGHQTANESPDEGETVSFTAMFEVQAEEPNETTTEGPSSPTMTSPTMTTTIDTDADTGTDTTTDTDTDTITDTDTADTTTSTPPGDGDDGKAKQPTDGDAGDGNDSGKAKQGGNGKAKIGQSADRPPPPEYSHTTSFPGGPSDRKAAVPGFSVGYVRW
ncbi:hypothetical protein BRC90_07990 [Halobacteriales archaeon QS_4_69_34]|nr:MAG: hypothetical protein BRC90_07990 [Halobacteriales archaeon QS_4_69_34]